MKKKYAIGVDIGGSHISAGAVETSTGEFVEHARFDNPVDNQGPAEEIVEKWGSAIRKAIDAAGIDAVAGVGLAMPGPFDYINGIALFSSATKKYEKIYGLNVSKALRDYLGLREDFPVRFVNDAAAFAIGESWKGKTKGARRSLAITLGTGLGSGFVSDGLPVFHSPLIPEDGFIYHLPYKGGIADDYFSSRGLIRAYKEISGRETSGAKEIAEYAKTDAAALELMRHFGGELARLLIPWLDKFKAEAVAVGGNISRAFDLFGGPMRQAIADAGLNIRVEPSELGDNAQILGAARIIDDAYWEKVLANMEK